MMGKEFIWSGDGRAEFKVLVEDGVCMTYEGGVLTNRLSYTVPEDRNAPWIDEVIQVWGERIPFQLEHGTPYLKLDGKWVASDTTIAERKVRLLESEKRSSIIMAVIGLLMLIGTGVMYVVRSGNIGNGWFVGLIGAVVIGNGIMQYNSVRKKVSA